MTETIRIGGDIKAPRPHLTRPLTYLPTKLDEAACLAVLAAIDPHVNIESVSAARHSIDVAMLDDALEYHPQLGIDERFRLKQALSACGILSLGKRI
jgi:hypothetical protein